MANTLKSVPAVAVPGQVMTGEIVAPSVGVDDFTGRVIPGAEPVPLGAVPQALTEICSGNAVNRRYATVDWTLVKVGKRYGVEAARNSGYKSDAALPVLQYKTAFFVVKHANVTAGASYLMRMGDFICGKEDANLTLYVGSTKVGFAPQTGKIEVVAAVFDGTSVKVFDGAGGVRTMTATPTASGEISMGASGFTDGAKGCQVFDAMVYDRALSDAEVATVRSNLESIWR